MRLEPQFSRLAICLAFLIMFSPPALTQTSQVLIDERGLMPISDVNSDISKSELNPQPIPLDEKLLIEARLKELTSQQGVSPKELAKYQPVMHLNNGTVQSLSILTMVAGMYLMIVEPARYGNLGLGISLASLILYVLCGGL